MQVTSANAGKDVLIISADRFEDSELLQPYQKLNEEGLSIAIASLRRGTITGKHGMEVSVDLRVDEVHADDYGMLLLPGGKAPAELRRSPEVLAIARRFMQQNRPVAAICHGPQILISAGVMAGRTATAYPSVAEELRQAGAHYVDREVVVDDNLITSRKPDDIPAFVHAILAQLHEA
jgi:protease I